MYSNQVLTKRALQTYISEHTFLASTSKSQPNTTVLVFTVFLPCNFEVSKTSMSTNLYGQENNIIKTEVNQGNANFCRFLNRFTCCDQQKLQLKRYSMLEAFLEYSFYQANREGSKGDFCASFAISPFRFAKINADCLYLVTGTRLFGLADSVWPFRSRDISVATFLYIRNWWNLLTLFR